MVIPKYSHNLESIRVSATLTNVNKSSVVIICCDNLFLFCFQTKTNVNIKR